MQNRYAGDIGDFGKFQLLRYLFLDGSYSLCQLWYMYPDESHNSDGMYIDYFEKVKGHDFKLESSLKNIIQNSRSVKALEEAKLLNNIIYFDEFLDNDCNLEFRNSWFKKAVEFSKNTHIILCDADNGIATKCDKTNKSLQILGFEELEKKPKSGKYIFFDEIEELFYKSESLIIYHHLNRCFAHDLQIELLKKSLEKDFKRVIALKHKPYSPRVYFFLCKEDSSYEFYLKKLKSFEKEYSIFWKLFH